jgi:hypothetical protein
MLKQVCSQQRHSSQGLIWYFSSRAHFLPAEVGSRDPSKPRRASTVRRGSLFAGSPPAIAFVPTSRRPTKAQTGSLRSRHHSGDGRRGYPSRAGRERGVADEYEYGAPRLPLRRTSELPPCHLCWQLMVGCLLALTRLGAEPRLSRCQAGDRSY